MYKTNKTINTMSKVVKTLDSRWRGCGLNSQFRPKWSRCWTLDGEVVGSIPSSGRTPHTPNQSPPYNNSASAQAAQFLPTLRSHCYKLKYETKVITAWVTPLGLGGNCLESRTDSERKSMHLLGIRTDSDR